MKAQGGRHRSLTPFMSRVNNPRNIPDNPTCPGADGQPVSGTLKKKWRTLDILQAGDSCRFLTIRHSPPIAAHRITPAAHRNDRGGRPPEPIPFALSGPSLKGKHPVLRQRSIPAPCPPVDILPCLTAFFSVTGIRACQTGPAMASSGSLRKSRVCRSRWMRSVSDGTPVTPRIPPSLWTDRRVTPVTSPKQAGSVNFP